MRTLFRRTLAVLALALLLVPSGGTAAPAASSTAMDGSPAIWTPALLGGPVGAHPQDGRDDVLLEVVGVSSAFGPETYKRNDFANTRNPDDFENQTTNWDTALGHSISFQVRVTAGDQALACDERFLAEAYITTFQGRLYGWTNGTIDSTPPSGPGSLCQSGPPGVRLFNLTFDLDGAPDTVSAPATQSLFPALLDGFYVVTLNLYYQVLPSATNPTGQGTLAGSLDIGFRIANPRLSHQDGLWRFPEETLRIWSDTGAAEGLLKDHYLMPPVALAPDQERLLNITFTGADIGAAFDRIDWSATRVASVPEVSTPPLPGDPLGPLTGKVEDQDERFPTVIVQAQRFSINNATVPASRAVQMPIRGPDFQARQTPVAGQDLPIGPTFRPLHIVTILLPADPTTFLTGAASYVQPVSERDFPIRGLDVMSAGDPLGATGTTRITLRDGNRETGGATGADAGDLFVLVGTEANHEFLTDAPVSRVPTETWATAEFSHVTFPADISEYTMLAVLYGDHDAFLGMTLARRGVDLQVADLRVVEGKTADLLVTVTNLANDYDLVPGESDFAIDVRLFAEGLPGDDAFNTTLTAIPEGQSRVVTIAIQGINPGTYSIDLSAESGELSYRRSAIVDVISREQARDEDRKWYQLPGPEAPLVALALAGLAMALRRRP